MMQKKEIHTIFNAFNKLKVLIIGDVMIDSYLWGKVERISPEAPVPVVAVDKRQERLGGAANVALNVQALGATPILCSVIGDDAKGNLFRTLLKQNKLSTVGIIVSKKRITTSKYRIISGSHQMLRVDEEMNTQISKSENKQLFATIKNLILKEKIDVIIFQDYDKGVISSELIGLVVDLANKKNIPITVDPKKRNFSFYKNVTLFKPNLKEIREGLKIEVDASDKENLVTVARQLEKLLKNKLTLITLSERGVFINDNRIKPSLHKIIPAHQRSIADVSGAGDTVISTASLCLALNLSANKIASISNLSGGLVCEEIGVIPIDKIKLLEECLKLDL